MNSSNQQIAATLFLQIALVIIEFTTNDQILEVLPSLIGVSVGLILLRLNQMYKYEHQTLIDSIYLINLLLVNVFPEPNQLVGYMKYLLIGKFIGANYVIQRRKQFLYLIIIGLTFTIEGFLRIEVLHYTLALLGWFILFFIVPTLIWSNQQIIKVQPPPLADITLLLNGQQLHDSVTTFKKDNIDKIENQLINFYEEMLQMYPEGIIILGQNKQIEFVSTQLQRLLCSRQHTVITETLMRLSNNYEEIQKEEQIHNMFTALSSKMCSNHLEISEDQVLDFIDLKSELSQNPNVEVEYIRIMKLIEEQIKELNSNNVSNSTSHQNITFLFEITMICKSDTISSLKTQNQQLLSQNYKGSTLFEVIFRPFISNHQPYIFIIIKDVTHFNQIKVLKTINQNKSQMLAQVSHEFRTPLNCIMLLVETLQLHQQLSQSVIDEYLQPILISAQTLLSLVNDLLDIAQLKAGKFRLVSELVNLARLLEEIQKFISPQLTKKGNKLKVQIIGNPSCIIFSDPNRIRQIIYNLVGNANKFSHMGIISLILNQLSPHQYKICVQDTGTGIDTLDQTKLFKAFGKLEKNAEMNAQGVGLGLMISNVLAERLSVPDIPNSQQQLAILPQGLQVYSEGVGKGTSFSFVVYDQGYNSTSIQARQSQSIGEQQCEDRNSTMRKKSKLQRQFDGGALKEDLYIMIVDDEGFNVHALQKALSVRFTVEGFYSGQDAILRVQQQLPLHTIILQDIEMPGLDGFQTTKLIREAVGDKVYIIGCSGHGNNMKQQCLENGMNNFIQKPVRLQHLMKIIDLLF